MLISLIKSEFNLTCIAEHRFHPVRKWRFDYAIVELKIAIEIEGGIWTNGRHTWGSGVIKDMEKYNTATALGWKIIRIQPNKYADALKYIEMILRE
jgi:very-short-patch-repair endonuclease